MRLNPHPYQKEIDELKRDYKKLLTAREVLKRHDCSRAVIYEVEAVMVGFLRAMQEYEDKPQRIASQAAERLLA